MKNLTSLLGITLVLLITCFEKTTAQNVEWRLSNYTYSNAVDPDGAGNPATGIATFTLQIRASSGTISNITGLSTGWSWQSNAAMLPTGSPCGTNSVAQPANITVASGLSSLVPPFTYNNVNECSGTVNFTAGGQVFDRRAAGIFDGGTITSLTTAWTDVFTVTLWSLGTTYPEAGYVCINSGAGGTPGPFSNYGTSDDQAADILTNSLTYDTPLPLGTPLPVVFSSINATCRGNGALISWTTEQESNSSHFIVERSVNGTDWNSIGSVAAANNSSIRRNYQLACGIPGKALFRIKQFDISGAYTQSTIMSTDCSIANTTTAIYPVPARNTLNVALSSAVAGRAQLQVTDLAGRKISNVSAEILPGKNMVSINLAGIASGSYLLQVLREDGKTENIKFIKE